MNANRQAILYHAMRVAQRFSVLAVGFSTVLYWVILINVAVTGYGRARDGWPPMASPHGVR